jgi:hypothetical protein
MFPYSYRYLYVDRYMSEGFSSSFSLSDLIEWYSAMSPLYLQSVEIINIYLTNGKGNGWFAWRCKWSRFLILLIVLYTGPSIKISYFACYFGRSFWGYGPGPPTTGISICAPLQRQCSLSACTCGWACHGWCFSPPSCKFSQWSLKFNIRESCNGRWGIELVDYWISMLKLAK